MRQAETQIVLQICRAARRSVLWRFWHQLHIFAVEVQAAHLNSAIARPENLRRKGHSRNCLFQFELSEAVLQRVLVTYRNGNYSVGLHADAEPKMGPVIASVVFPRNTTATSGDRYLADRFYLPSNRSGVRLTIHRF